MNKYNLQVDNTSFSVRRSVYLCRWDVYLQVKVTNQEVNEAQSRCNTDTEMDVIKGTHLDFSSDAARSLWKAIVSHIRLCCFDMHELLLASACAFSQASLRRRGARQRVYRRRRRGKDWERRGRRVRHRYEVRGKKREPQTSNGTSTAALWGSLFDTRIKHQVLEEFESLCLQLISQAKQTEARSHGRNWWNCWAHSSKEQFVPFRGKLTVNCSFTNAHCQHTNREEGGGGAFPLANLPVWRHTRAVWQLPPEEK